MKKSSYALFALLLSLYILTPGCSSKNKDAKIKTEVEKTLASDPLSVNASFTVNAGIVTIGGDCKDDNTKMQLAERVKKVKGVKSVINNCKVPAPVVNASEEELQSGLRDALKDYPTVQYSVVDGKIILKGEVTKERWRKLKESLDKFTSRGYELSGLTIK